jgi:hypothetical protein
VRTAIVPRVSSLVIACAVGSALLGALAAAADKAKPAEPEVPAADISAVKDKLKLFTDGKKHYMALTPFEGTDHTYYGDGKAFYAQRVIGSGSSGRESFDFTYWEPRVRAPYQASFEFREGKYRVQCDERKTEMTAVPDAEAKAILESAKFFKARWRHRAHALARDDRGTYYYVDRVREPEDSKTYRLFSGPKGSMKPLKMINVVSDSEGEIFSTKAGDLRLVLDRQETSWIKGKSRTKLIHLPVEDNHVLIYTDLGVYTGQRLGTPCDDL